MQSTGNSSTEHIHLSRPAVLQALWHSEKARQYGDVQYGDVQYAFFVLPPHSDCSELCSLCGWQICANLDVSAIVSPKENSGELQRNVPKPVKKYDIVNERTEVSHSHSDFKFRVLVGNWNIANLIANLIGQRMLTGLQVCLFIAGFSSYRKYLTASHIGSNSCTLIVSQDPFGDHLKSMMSEIHDYSAVKNFGRNFGSQEYEADVVQLEKQGELGIRISDENRYFCRFPCMVHKVLQKI